MTINKEIFHNAFALSLGYELLIDNKRFSIDVNDNEDDPIINIKNGDGSMLLSFKASEAERVCFRNEGRTNDFVFDTDIRKICYGTNQAYHLALKNLF